VLREFLRCAVELFGIFENNQFILQLGMQASMHDLNAHYPLDQCFPTFLGLWHPAKEKYNLRHPVADS